jgi:hypothetical protein
VDIENCETKAKERLFHTATALPALHGTSHALIQRSSDKASGYGSENIKLGEKMYELNCSMPTISISRDELINLLTQSV